MNATSAAGFGIVALTAALGALGGAATTGPRRGGQAATVAVEIKI